MSELSVSLLGPFAASLNDEPLTQFRTRSVQALLVYLVCEAERPHQRETLMDLLWPGMPLPSAQANMRQTLYRLRRIIPEVQRQDGLTAVPFLLTNRQTIQINPDAAYFADVQHFDALVDSDPAQAITLYRGDFLADFYLPDSETFETWVAARRADFRRQVLISLETLAAVHLQQGDFDEAEMLARRQLAIDNLRESSHRQVLEALARSGRRQEALTHYNDLRRLLQGELALDPQAETDALVAAIRTGELAASKPTMPRRSVWLDEQMQPTSHNLPQLLASFIGRENEMAAVAGLIKNNRLVMLTGSGGIGKTILCLQVGRKLLETFPGGVWLVELAPVADPALVPRTAADSLGLRESPDQAISDMLLDYLREKKCLLILDNCEHLIDAAAQFAVTLLQTCPQLKILASSREALGVPGEVPYRVPPLSLPDSYQKISIEDWKQYDALRLFAERAAATMPEFQVTQDNFASLVEICQRLDGLPLALELAAARVNVLTTEQIAGRLNDRFRLLTGGSRTALPRQQTLRALIDWSWDLLDDAEKLLLCRLSVFSGGMNLETAEAVCAGDGLDPYDLLDLLSELVNKSLLITKREPGHETRYQMLETIRQYAQERLLVSGHGEKYRHRHLEYFLYLAEQAEMELVGPDQAAWHKNLTRELDNLRAALSWARETNIADGLRLITHIWRFWAHGNVREGEAWLAKFLAYSDKVTPEIVAKALWVHGHFKLGLAELDHACALAEKSLALYRKIGDQQGIALSLSLLGWTIPWRGEHAKGRKLLLESLALFQSVGDKLGTADVLAGLGYLEWKFNYEQAMAYLEESESLHRELGNLFGVIGVQDNFAQLAIWQGDYDTARRLLEAGQSSREQLGIKEEAYILQLLGELYFRLEDFPKALQLFEKSLAISHDTGQNYSYYWAVIRVAYTYLRLGQDVQARAVLEKSLRLFQKMGSLDGMIFTLEGFASLAVRQELPDLAARLFAWSDATRFANQDSRPPVEQGDINRDLVQIIDMIGKEAYSAAYAAGKAMTLEQAIATALELEIGEITLH